MNKFCESCGKPLVEGQVCDCQTQDQQPQQPYAQPQQPYAQPQQPYAQPQQPYGQPQQPYTQATTDNSKTFSILAYIGFLFVIGMVAAPENANPKVRFHVGQGIILFIAEVVLGIVNSIVNAIAWAGLRDTIDAGYWGTYQGGLNGFGVFITVVVGLAVAAFSIVFTIMGIMNAMNGKEKPLPIIGQFSFYK